MSNRRTLTETLITVRDLPPGAYLESDGLVVMEAEHFGQRINGPTHQWNLKTGQSGYTGTSYLQPLPDIDTLYQTDEITASPQAAYPIDFTTPGTYTVWLRGYPTNAAGDSVYVGLGEQVITLTGFSPFTWTWASEAIPLVITSTGVSTVSLWMREDGLRIDRLLITTDTGYIPTDFGPAETEYQIGGDDLIMPLTRTIVYTYDNLYRLTGTDYTTGENYQYSYDPVGNRLQQVINGDTTDYLYDATNRLASVDGQSYTFDDNGNLLNTGVMTNSWDAANRLVETERGGTILEPIYNGVGDRVAQTVGTTTTNFALDVQGLPEVIYTSNGDAYLHLPGVIMTESNTGEVRYLLSDGLGSVRQAVDETAQVVAYYEFDPYGNPVNNTTGGDPYGYTGEWYEGYMNLLHLRARWYLPDEGVFLSRDAVESEPAYQYVRGNPVNLTDKSGLFSSEKIQDSLEGNRRIGDYFQNRPGLYWLLRNASEKDRVTPLVVDFVFSNDKYPLRSSNPDTQALIRCENQMLRFETSMGSLTLRQYLAYLDRVARQQDKSEWWRVETMELHYYKLSHSKTEVSYYNDLLDDNYNTSVLPDYVGDSTSLPVKWILSAGWANLFDRHGYYYKVIFGGVGFGVNPPNAFEGYPSLSSGTYVEGYLSTRSEDLIKSSLTGAGYSQQAGLLYGEAVSIPLSWFSDLSSSVPYREHSVGFQIGTSINIGWGEQRGPRNEAMRWDWLENLKHPSTVPSTSDDDRFYLDPWWRSAFLNSGSGNNCSCER